MKIKDRIAKLIDVKSLVTFAFTGAFVYLVFRGDDIPDIFATTYTTILGFYFGSQVKKKEEKEND